MYRIAYQPKARKDLLSLPADARRAVAYAIDSLGSMPRPHGARKLASQRPDLYRLRVGRYRVIYQVQDKVLLVLVIRVARRDEATYRRL